MRYMARSNVTDVVTLPIHMLGIMMHGGNTLQQEKKYYVYDSSMYSCWTIVNQSQMTAQAAMSRQAVLCVQHIFLCLLTLNRHHNLYGALAQ